MRSLRRPVQSDEAANEVVGRVGEDVGRSPDLRDHAAGPKNHDLVAEQEGLVDVVGDEHDGLAELALQAQQFTLEFVPHDRVDGAERLVHQQHVRIGDQAAADAHPLLLPAGQLPG